MATPPATPHHPTHAQITTAELEALARSTVRMVAGDAGVEEVEVAPDVDFDGDPIYQFTFVINQARALQPPGELRLRFHQRLRDALLERGEERYLRLQILDRTGWDKRKRA